MPMQHLALIALSLAPVVGSPGNAATIDVHPGDSLHQAIQQARELRENDADRVVEIRIKPGVYYLDEPLSLGPADSHTHLIGEGEPADHSARAAADVSLRAGRRLKLTFRPYRDGILQADVPEGLTFDQLLINGQRQHMARYPNFDPDVAIYGGYAADCLDPDRVSRWDDPVGGFVHAQQKARWGAYSFVIRDRLSDGRLVLDGGWQHNRCPAHKYRYHCPCMTERRGTGTADYEGLIHPEYRYVENIFAELDAPGEWYLDEKESTLYLIPPPDVDLGDADIEVSGPARLIELIGTSEKPVRDVKLINIDLRHTARTFMGTDEPLLRSDWRINRTGAVYLEGTEDVTIDGCTLKALGGNAVFASGYNRRVRVTGCLIEDIGAGGVNFVGLQKAVRRDYTASKVHVDNIDRTPGPKTDDYPADCLVEQCLIHDFGRFEKQVAGVQIDMARRVTVRHCSIYDCPRAGINIGSGAWGGHVIEHCDVFATVLETHDHGAFNCWGRDRFWRLRDATPRDRRDLALLDVVEPIALRDSRWRCDHGWDIDLDDGGTNYRIINNVMLSGGLKFGMEGYDRVARNNIMINGTLSAHLWPPYTRSVFTHNIVTRSGYIDARVADWGKQIDYNLLPSQAALERSRSLGLDEHSIAGEPKFPDPARGDYRVADDSPAMKIGFENFPMARFGVTLPRLRAIARGPEFPELRPPVTTKHKVLTLHWRGATVKTLEGLDEQSATGMSEQRGAYLIEVPEDSDAYRDGLRENDVILAVDGQRVDAAVDLIRLLRVGRDSRGVVGRDSRGVDAKDGPIVLKVWRRQEDVAVELNR